MSHQSHPKRRGMINWVVVYQLCNHPRRELWMIYNPMWMISWTSWWFWSNPLERRRGTNFLGPRGWRQGLGWMGSWVSLCHDYPVHYIKDAIRLNKDQIFHRYSTHFCADPLRYERICVTATPAWNNVSRFRIHWNTMVILQAIDFTLVSCCGVLTWFYRFTYNATLCVLSLGFKMCM